MVVRIQDNAFDIGDELREFAAGHTDQGAVVSFTGLVRDSVGDLLHMELEHYPAMTKSALEAIDEQATRRWQLGASLIIHRFGKLVPGDPIMIFGSRIHDGFSQN